MGFIGGYDKRKQREVDIETITGEKSRRVNALGMRRVCGSHDDRGC